MNDFERDLCLAAVKKWGITLQLVMVVEECAELQKAVTKHWRGEGDVEAIIEEAVDLEWMLRQIEVMFPHPEVWARIRREKEEHLVLLVNQEGGSG